MNRLRLVLTTPLMAVTVLLTQIVPTPAHGDLREGGVAERTENGRTQHDRTDHGRRGAMVSEQARTPDEVVLGVLSPERQLQPRLDLTVGDCAQRSGAVDRRDGADCSQHSTHGPRATNSFRATPSCAYQCIIRGVAYARGPGARLVVETDTPARIVLTIPGSATVADSGPGQTKLIEDFLDLEAGTTYTVNATATDANGHTAEASGQFTTLRRFATVGFGGFDIEEKASCCNRFWFYFKVGDEWHPELKEFSGQPFLPATLPGVRAVTVEDAPPHLSLLVQVVQTTADESQVCEAAVYPKDDPHNRSGTSNVECSTWMWAGAGVDLDWQQPFPPASWTEHELSVSIPSFHTEPGEISHSPLKFTAPATVKVWYATQP